MADTMQTSSLIVIAQNYKDDIVRQVNRTATALKLFPATPGEGAGVALVAEADGVVAETFSEGADATNFGSDSQVAATIPWARYRGNIHVTGTALAVAASSRTPIGNIKLWARNMLNAVEGVAKKIDTDFFTGAGGNALVGLDSAVASASNTYAGIDRSQPANAFWRPYVADGYSAGALTFAQIRTDLSSIKVQSGYRPDVALVSPATYNKIAALFDPLKQYAYQVVDKVFLAGRSAVQLEGGAGGLSFDGCVFVEDSFCPDATIYYLNSSFVKTEYCPLDMSNLGGDETASLSMVDGLGESVPLGMAFEMLAKNGDSERAMMKVYPQLAVLRPNACGARIRIQ